VVQQRRDGGEQQDLEVGDLQATDPRVTVVATPDPDTVPSRKPARVAVRPGAAADRVPKAAKLTSMKNRPAPEYSSTAP
jgi:hypothetical protein